MSKKLERFLGFDFGTKKIGIAIGQTLTQSARPLTTLSATCGEPNWHDLDKLIKRWQPDALVIGIPLNMDGTRQNLSDLAHEFAQKLKSRYQIITFEAEERLTTKAAKEQLFEQGGLPALQDGQVDQVAAQLILQNWLDEQSEKKKL